MIFVKTSQVHLSWDKQKAFQDLLCACMCIFSLCHCSHTCGCVFVFVFDDVCMFVKTPQVLLSWDKQKARQDPAEMTLAPILALEVPIQILV